MVRIGSLRDTDSEASGRTELARELVKIFRCAAEAHEEMVVVRVYHRSPVAKSPAEVRSGLDQCETATVGCCGRSLQASRIG